MELKKVGYANQSFYYGFSGEQSTIIRFDYTLDTVINAALLEKAQKKTLGRYPNFAQKLTVENHNIFYIANVEEPQIYPLDDKRQYNLGTKDTNGYLFRIMCGENKIVVMCHHGLADGKGVYEFAKTIVYNYLKEAGLAAEEASVECSKEENREAEQEYSFEKYAVENAKPLWVAGKEEAFRIPEEYYEEEISYCRKMKISCSVKELLKIARKYETSPVPILSILISQALDQVYGVGEEPVIGYIPVNLRPLYHSVAMNNFTLAIPLSYREKIKGKDLETQATIQRGIMDLQIQRENFDYRLWMNCVSGAKVEGIQADIAMKQKSLVQRIKENSRGRYSYLLTYLGKSVMPPEMEAHVKEMEFYIPSFIVPFSMCVNTFGDHMTIVCTQNFEADGVAKKMAEVMEEYGLEVTYEDCGYIYPDKLILTEDM